MGDSRFIRASKLAKGLKIDNGAQRNTRASGINPAGDQLGAISDREAVNNNPKSVMHNSKFYGQSYKNLKRSQYQN